MPKKKNLNNYALNIACFLAGGGLALLYIYARPVKLACMFVVPNAMFN